MAGPIRVFIATSLDGFIAGENDDLSWLPAPVPGGEDYGFREHMEATAAILMGRSTYDVVASMDEEEWPYGDTPLFVATTRPLDGAPETVRAISGDAVDLVAAVQAEVGDGGIYADGGNVIRQLIDGGLVDELIVTVVPVILGRGAPLFAGTAFRHGLTLRQAQAFDDGLVQLRYDVAS